MIKNIIQGRTYQTSHIYGVCEFLELAHEPHRLDLDVQRFGLNSFLLELRVAQQVASTASTSSTAVSRSP